MYRKCRTFSEFVDIYLDMFLSGNNFRNLKIRCHTIELFSCDYGLF